MWFEYGPALGLPTKMVFKHWETKGLVFELYVVVLGIGPPLFIFQIACTIW